VGKDKPQEYIFVSPKEAREMGLMKKGNYTKTPRQGKAKKAWGVFKYVLGRGEGGGW
jgi:hypothetical protein